MTLIELEKLKKIEEKVNLFVECYKCGCGRDLKIVKIILNKINVKSKTVGKIKNLSEKYKPKDFCFSGYGVVKCVCLNDDSPEEGENHIFINYCVSSECVVVDSQTDTKYSLLNPGEYLLNKDTKKGKKNNTKKLI
jgi:hypothetical protein